MAKKGPTSKRYEETTKRKAAKAIASGKLTVTEVRRKFGVNGSDTIRGWLKKYAPKHLPRDYERLAITRQTTKCAGNERVRHSWALVWVIACSIASTGIATSMAFSTSPVWITGDTSEKSFRFISNLNPN